MSYHFSAVQHTDCYIALAQMLVVVDVAQGLDGDANCLAGRAILRATAILVFRTTIYHRESNLAFTSKADTMNYVALPKIEVRIHLRHSPSVPPQLTPIQLHAHLTGSISRRTLHEVWLRKKATGETDLEDPLVKIPENKHDYNLETQVVRLVQQPLTVTLICRGCLRSFFPLFSTYIYNLLTDEASIRYATNAVLTDFLNDGVVYLELRTTPRRTPSLSPEAYTSTLLTTIAAFEASHPQLHTRLILSVDRRHNAPAALSTVSLAAQFRARGVVGVDLCGDPTARPGGAVSLFATAFAEARGRGLGITVHFAEAQASGSRAELDELLSWRPDRLGHVIWEDAETKREIARRGLCLELCLSCNVQAGMVKGGFEAHHFGEWRAVGGVKISLGVSCLSSLPSLIGSLTGVRLTMLASLEAPCQTSTAS